LDDNGLVNKKELAKIVFSNQDALNTLNGLIHPKVRQIFSDWCDRIEQSDKNIPYILIESAILYETGLNKLLDGVIVVYLDKEERIKRAMLRDNATREQIEARISKQMPDEKKLELADFIILNYEGNPLDKQVEIINRILQ
jgi:dephospho-CoA kinase